MALRLSESQLAQALAGLSPTERFELLSLLEARERIEAETPEDTRRPLEDFLAEFGPPTPYDARRDARFDRLLAERQAPDADIGACFAWIDGILTEADEAATAEDEPDAKAEGEPPAV